MGLTAIKKESIGEQVLAQMKEQILSGDWKEGEKIPSENQLCETFGVSRVTVRQAIQKLVAQGLLETRLGEGSFVKGFNLETFIKGVIPADYLSGNDLVEIMHFRLQFEPMVAAWASNCITETQLSQMEEIIISMEKYGDEPEQYIKFDNEFHMLLAQSTGNQVAAFIGEMLRDVMVQSMRIITEAFGTSHGINCHRRIIDALRVRNSEVARQEMFFHIDYSMRYYIDTVLKEDEEDR